MSRRPDPKDVGPIIDDRTGDILTPVFNVIVHCATCKKDHGSLLFLNAEEASRFLASKTSTLCQDCFLKFQETLMKSGSLYSDLSGRIRRGGA